MSWIKRNFERFSCRVGNIFNNLIGKRDDSSNQGAAPPQSRLPPLEPVHFPDPRVFPGKPPDMVVDFGTTATVVALVRTMRTYDGSEYVSLDLLAGETELSSDMSVDENGQVAVVGAAAYTDSAANQHKYYSSLKRYVELESRGAGQGVTFSDIVSGYLQKAIGEKYKSHAKIGRNSRIVISVPNSFNPKAVDDLRQGVIKAITALNSPGEGITDANIRVARESEAIAYLYRRGDRIQAAPASGRTSEAAAFEWQTLHSTNRPDTPAAVGNERVIVLDVGGGTTDLSLIEVQARDPNAANQGFRVNVLMNAGVAVGGTDVDKLLLRSALDPNVAALGSLLQPAERFNILTRIRHEKETGAERFFSDPDSGESSADASRDIRSAIIEMLPNETLRRVAPRSPETVGHFRKEANDRMDRLLEISVRGLFHLIPKSGQNNVGKILLTGRGSQIQQIRDAVIQEANTLGAEILTLTRPYHLKLAVAYGCALVHRDEFSGAKLPSGTLGRQLRLFVSGANDALVDFSGDMPVSSVAPTLWQVTCPSPRDNPVSYELCEYRTALPRAALAGYRLDELLDLGCFRWAATWEVPIRAGGHATQKVLLAWHPETEAYYSLENQSWNGPPSTSVDLKSINLVTGLPLGFPFEDNPK